MIKSGVAMFRTTANVVAFAALLNLVAFSQREVRAQGNYPVKPIRVIEPPEFFTELLKADFESRGKLI